ncbi:hypothetical protein [Ruminococcus sp.]|uniref:hypothetical protein n=1 Tax=Ruminococcus sp. TaxID=41978 RepID=UPI001B4D6971|nr:hypothetical protein [Ruminococcus sp.]MBP5433593.1 hypothetical protein [Ruminococcus sp.]
MNSDVYSRFFTELKQYNSTNFKTLHTADLTADVDVSVKKAFSSVVTRYFIFCEKHPELSPTETYLLFYQLKIDMIARYFANYPNSNTDELRSFQLELRNYLDTNKVNAEVGA